MIYPQSYSNRATFCRFSLNLASFQWLEQRGTVKRSEHKVLYINKHKKRNTFLLKYTYMSKDPITWPLFWVTYTQAMLPLEEPSHVRVDFGRSGPDLKQRESYRGPDLTWSCVVLLAGGAGTLVRQDKQSDALPRISPERCQLGVL